MQATSVRDSTINDLRGQVDSLTAQLSQARLDNDTLSQQIASLTTQLEQKTALLSSLQKAYNALKKKCGSP